MKPSSTRLKPLLLSLGGLNLALDLLNSDDPNARFFAAKLLEDLDDPRAIPDLKKMALEDKNEMARNMASHALAFMKSDEAIPSLRQLFKESEADGVRINSLAGLAIHKDPAGIRDTVAFLKDKDQKKAYRAAMVGILILPYEHLMPIAAEAVTQFGSNEPLMGLVVNYYSQIGTHAARDSLQAIVDNQSMPAAIQQAAQAALAR